MISIVGCCHSAKLCAHAASDFQLQQLSSQALHNWYILTNFSAFSTSKLFLILDHAKSYVEKNTAELVAHAHKLDMKLQSLFGNGFSPFALHMLAKPYLPLRSELTNNT